MMRGRGNTAFWSFGGLVLALLAIALTHVQQQAAPPSTALVACTSALPLSISLPATLPAPLSSTQPAAATPSVPAGPPVAAAASATPTTTATPTSATTATPTSATPPPEAAPRTAALLRGDDPPETHALQISSGGLLPLLVPRPCVLTPDQRHGPEPCLQLLPPGGRLCASGVVGDGAFSADPAAPIFALQAARVTLTDANGVLRLDALQGYVRYDDPARGLRLLCPEIRSLQSVGPNARTFIALCQNDGQGGWAVSGQATDGNNAAPDSVGLAIDAPDGSSRTLTGTLAVGAVQVRTPAGEAGP